MKDDFETIPYQGIQEIRRFTELRRDHVIVSLPRGENQIWIGYGVESRDRDCAKSNSDVHDYRVRAVHSHARQFYFVRDGFGQIGDNNATWLKPNDDFSVPLACGEVRNVQNCWKVRHDHPELNSISHFERIDDLLARMDQRFREISGFDMPRHLEHREFIEMISEGGAFDPLTDENWRRFFRKKKWNKKKSYMISVDQNLLTTFLMDCHIYIDTTNLYMSHLFAVVGILPPAVAHDLGTEFGFQRTVSEAFRDAGLCFESNTVTCGQVDSTMMYACVVNLVRLDGCLVMFL